MGVIDYKNWVPRGMYMGFLVAGIVCLAIAVVVGLAGFVPDGPVKLVISIILAVAGAVLVVAGVWMLMMHRAFSYDGARQMSRQIIEGVASRTNLPDGGEILDVGCGSGALAIACAKRNPAAHVTGIDRWGKEYASFSKALCERNALAEGVGNTSFAPGDATHLDFPDESFDAVTSNYVYHNIPDKNRQAILLETLRVLRKGGTFAIHDIFSKSKYGDMNAFVEQLRGMGYESAELVDTTDGTFMTPSEARWMMLSGSAILVGRK